MAIRKLPVKPRVTAQRSTRIDRFFNSKTRFNQQGFFEGLFRIKTNKGYSKTEYGYSKEFNVGNRFEYREAIESAKLNAIVKVAYRDGLVISESDDVIELENDNIESVELIDYKIYYLQFKKESISRDIRQRKDGSLYAIVRFRQNGKFIKGGGLEKDRQAQTETTKDFEIGSVATRQRERESKTAARRLK